MYKHILVAVDGSDTSDLALQEAIKLAGEMESQMRIVHVVDFAAPNWDAEFINVVEILEAMSKSGEAILNKASSVAREAGITAETRLVKIESLGQRITEAIAEEADKWPANLIVLGTHGRRGFSHLLLGSMAEGVIRVATKPVLLIRGK
jgi:nucleotide-binding universal stress UspA family protein